MIGHCVAGMIPGIPAEPRGIPAVKRPSSP
jgi:hypothetical protein